MIWIDRTFVVLLVLLSAGHGILGTLMSRPLMEPYTVWSFSGSIAAWLIALLNWMRGSRPGDRVLAFWALVGSVTWIGMRFWLMEAAGMWADWRPWAFIAVCAVLAIFSLRAMLAPALAAQRLKAPA